MTPRAIDVLIDRLVLDIAVPGLETAHGRERLARLVEARLAGLLKLNSPVARDAALAGIDAGTFTAADDTLDTLANGIAESLHRGLPR